MNGVQQWMRLKVKADTFFLPYVDGSVYFRNNAGSFRMEGTAIQSWIEKLLPVFNGQHTLASLTEGLPEPYRDRIYAVAGTLYSNGFVRDVSADDEHQLSDKVVQHFTPQIEFVDNLRGSGGFRFQTYRNAKILIVGTGSMLVSLVGALFESGLATVNFLNTGDTGDAADVHVQRLNELADRYSDIDAQVAVIGMSSALCDTDSLRNVVRIMDAVLYVSDAGDVEELRHVERICIEENTLFFPAICMDHLGTVGPMILPNKGVGMTSSWDSAWRRIHKSVLQNDLHVCASTSIAGALLSNVLTFALFKSITGIEDSASGSRVYTLNIQTLEGKWHDLIPGAIAPRPGELRRVEDLAQQLARKPVCINMEELLSYFASLTDETSGIFHVWDEGGLTQLPLVQCRVQPVDPLSKGPATLLCEMVCSGLTHEEARREAGLTGIEAYVRQLTREALDKGQFVGVGTGWTVAEAIGRGLHQALTHELTLSFQQSAVKIRPVVLGEVKDTSCKFYLEALCMLDKELVIGQGDDLFGFPVVWVGVNGRFVASTGLSTTMALQHVLEYVLLRELGQLKEETGLDGRQVAVPLTHTLSEEAASVIDIELWPGLESHPEFVTSAIQVLAENGMEVFVVDLACEPFLTETLAGVFGVSIRQRGKV